MNQLHTRKIQMNNFYVYQYNREDGTPYYIGKGKGNRAWTNRKRVKPPKDKNRIIIISKDCTEQEAFQIEEYLIAYYGRKDKGTGILRNMTDGGDGTNGLTISQETRKKISEYRKGKKHSDETRKKVSKALTGIKRSEETKKKMSKPKSEETKLKMRKPKSEETKVKMKLYWQNRRRQRGA